MIPRRSLPVLAGLGLAAPGIARAAFPERPLTMVIPFAPGGTTDLIGRAIAPEMSRLLGQAVVIEQRPGAGGHVGGAYVANAAPADGHTFILGSMSKSAGPSLQSLNYDPLAGLTPLGGAGAFPMLMLTSPEAPFRGVQDVVAAARRAPGTVTYASSGIGSGTHLVAELLAATADIQMVHVPYRGAGAVYPDLISRRVDITIANAGAAASHVRAGSVRALGISTGERSQFFPDIPTFAEQGITGFDFGLWLGFFTRSGTPLAAFARLEEALVQAMATNTVQEALRQSLAEPIPTDAAGFAAYFRADVERWAALVRAGRLARLDG